MERILRGPLAVCLLALLAFPASAADSPGREIAWALSGGRVIAAPGRVFDPGVVVIRGGVIEAVGSVSATPVPADATVIDTSGKVVHAAFIDANVSTDRLAGKAPKAPKDDDDSETAKPSGGGTAPSGPASHPVAAVRAEERALDALVVKDDVAETYRKLGFAVVAAVPSSGVMRGRGAVVSLADGPITGRILLPESGQFVSLEPPDEDNYPASKMGAVAVARQAFLDALWWRDAEAAYAKQPSGRARPRLRASSAALVPAAEGRETVVFEAADALALLRAARLAREMKLKARYVGGNDEYRLSAEVVAAQPDLVLRVNFPQPEKLDSETEWLDVPLTRLRAFDRASSNPKWLKDAGLTFSFTTAGLEDPKTFPARVRETLARGLSRDDALAAVTTVPARQLGLQDRLGSLEAGKIADLVVATAEPFAENARVAEIWIDGARIQPRQTREEREEAAKPKKAEQGAGRGRAPRSRARGRSRGGAGRGRRARRDRLDAGPGRNPGRRGRGRLRRQGRGRGQGPRGSRGGPGDRRPGQARHARHHRCALAHRRGRRRQRRNATTSRPKCASATW